MVDERVHGVDPLLCLGWIRVSRVGDWNRAVDEVTLQLRRHERHSPLVGVATPPSFGAFESAAAVLTAARWHRSQWDVIGTARSRATDNASPHVGQRP
jgi:hypothetical protein